MQDRTPDRAQKTVSPALSAQKRGAQSGSHALEAISQRRTARKGTGACAGSNTAAAFPVPAASHSGAPSAHQQMPTGSVIQDQGRPSTPEQARAAPPAQRLGPAVSGQQQQPAPFNLSAALRGRQSAQAHDQSARPDQAQPSLPSISVAAGKRSPQNTDLPAAATQPLPEAQTHRTAGQPSGSLGMAPSQPAGRSGPPGQMPGLLGKRAVKPGSEPPAKRAKRSDGSLLGLANMVIRDFARRRLGSASLGHVGVRHAGIPDM